MSRQRQIVIARCCRCGTTYDIGRLMPATRTDPSWLDGDIPDECEECGCEDFTTESEWIDPTSEDER